jgi:hypothetical protein
MAVNGAVVVVLIDKQHSNELAPYRIIGPIASFFV